MMSLLEVACPKCPAKVGEKCVGLRGKSAGQPLAGGAHVEREDAAREAPDPDLSARADLALQVPCSKCGIEAGERCVDGCWPLPVGEYHDLRGERAARWLQLARALPFGPRDTWKTVDELLALPEFAEQTEGVLIFALDAMRAHYPHMVCCNDDDEQQERWGLTTAGLEFVKRAAVDPATEAVEELSDVQPEAADRADELPPAVPPASGAFCVGHPIVRCDHEDCATCPNGLALVDGEPPTEPPSDAAEGPLDPAAPAPTVPPESDVARRHLTRNLPCELDDDEIAERALEVFRLEREIDGIKANAKEEIKPKENRIGSLKDQIRKGKYEDVTCLETRDWATNTLTLARTDTGEVLERRPLTPEERQRELFPRPAPRPLDRLPRALQAVGIAAEIRDVLHGPRLDRYQLLLGAAKDLKTFTGGLPKLAFELGLEQRLLTWRQGSEPRSLELDIPRAPETWTKYGLADLRDWILTAPAGAGLPLCPGVDALGQPYWLDLARAPHLLVAGATGSGKSVALHAMLCSLLMTRSPNDVEFIMLDPKRVELRAYAATAHRVTIVSDHDEMRETLDRTVQRMEERYIELERMEVRDLDGARAAGSKMPRIVVVVEELADLVITGGSAQDSLIRLAQKSRAAGIHLLLATQRPDADTFSGLLRSNVDARIALAVQKASESRIILDTDGAESLMKPGDMLIRYGGTVTRVHGLYLSQEEIATVGRPKQAALEFALDDDLGDGADDPDNVLPMRRPRPVDGEVG